MFMCIGARQTSLIIRANPQHQHRDLQPNKQIQYLNDLFCTRYAVLTKNTLLKTGEIRTQPRILRTELYKLALSITLFLKIGYYLTHS